MWQIWSKLYFDDIIEESVSVEVSNWSHLLTHSLTHPLTSRRIGDTKMKGEEPPDCRFEKQCHNGFADAEDTDRDGVYLKVYRKLEPQDLTDRMTNACVSYLTRCVNRLT